MYWVEGESVGAGWGWGWATANGVCVCVGVCEVVPVSVRVCEELKPLLRVAVAVCV